MITTLEPSLAVRGKVIAALKGDAVLNALVPAARVYPSKVPAGVAWPFIRIGTLTSAPLRTDGQPGGDVSGVVHCFVKLDTAAGILDPESHAADINAHVVRVLDAIDAVDLSDGADLSIHIRQAQVIEDSAEADAYHGITSFDALAL